MSFLEQQALSAENGWRRLPKRQNHVKPPCPAALVIAHPGHELRIHAWLERFRPSVCVITDGGGRNGVSRLAATAEILAQTGAAPGCLFGRYPDTAIYHAILEQRFDVFLDMTEELATALILNRIACVAGDAVEGYNPSHDVCRLVVNAALALVERRTGRRILNYDFPLTGCPKGAEGSGPDVVRLKLTEGEFSRKVTAARRYRALQGEVESALAVAGRDAFRVECLRAVPHPAPWFPTSPAPPFYELHGERRVAEGHYRQVLRYRQHMAPLIDCVRRHVEGRVSCAA